MYGIYDTKDNCWIGDDKGPKTFDDLGLARIASQVWEQQIVGSDLGCRFVARVLPPESWRLKDDVAVKHSTLEAIRRIERSSDG